MTPASNWNQVLLGCFFSLLLIQKAYTQTEQADTLRLVHVVYRHGDRSPSGTFPTDPNQKEWSKGWSQLTKLGMQQQYELGKYLRQRYSNFMSPSYIREEIYVRSTDTDRTIQSALCNLAGFYEVKNDSEKWSDLFPRWQPIPIHMLPHDQDHLLAVKKNDCNEYKETYKRQTQSLIQRMNERFQALFEFLKEKTQLKKVDFTTVKKVFNPVFRAVSNKLPRPEWMNDTVYELTADLTAQHKESFINTPEKSRFRGGQLLGDIIQRMKNASLAILRQQIRRNRRSTKDDNDDDDETTSLRKLKLQMYSAHEETVGALLGTLGLLNGIWVPYAGCFIVELHQVSVPDSGSGNMENKAEFRVQLFYRNETTRVPYPLIVEGCPEHSCLLDTFEQAVKQNTMYSEDDWRSACGISDACLTSSATSINLYPNFLSGT